MRVNTISAALVSLALSVANVQAERKLNAKTYVKLIESREVGL